jgi:hypothetical protein
MISAALFDVFSDDVILSSSPPPIIQNSPQTSSPYQKPPSDPRPQIDFVTAQKLLQDHTGFKPHNGQVEALLLLYRGVDSVLIAPCGWGRRL